MSRPRRALLLQAGTTAFLLIAGPFVWPAAPRAATVLAADLERLTVTAHAIYRGTVVDLHKETRLVHGVELPVTRYVVRVEEPFKGTFETRKGQRFTELTMLGHPGASVGGMPLPGTTLERRSILEGLPRLDLGRSYLLFTTRPVGSGLSTTVGLGQGCFRIAGEGSGMTAVNAFGNRGLYPPDMSTRVFITGQAPGIEQAASDPAESLSYARLAARLRELLPARGREGGR
jgi:hypothetical protein